MTLRRPFVLCALLLASAALGAPALADDAQAAAAAAAAQAVGGMATGGAAGAAAAGAGRAAGKNTGPGSGGHFQRELTAPTIQRKGPAKRTKGGKAAKSSYSRNAPESKYKTRELVENSEQSYRFDENGNPKSTAAAPKKLSSKSAKKSSSASDDKDDKPGACSTDEPCTVKNSDADAL